MADRRSEVAERYAEALFELTRDENTTETVESDLDGIVSALDASDELRRLIASPVFEREEKARVLDEILARGNAHQTTRNFVKLMAHKGRIRELSAVIAAFRRRLADARGEVSAEATAATPLTAEQEAELRQQIEASVGKSVKLSTRVDPSLLGGLVVKVGSRMIDSSLRTKLNRLQQSLKEA